MNLSDRQSKILEALVREYTRTAEATASSVLALKYKLPWSSATIRAEMAALESAGYIYQPHTSAGRVPTDLGFRHYVNLLEDKLSDKRVASDSSLIERTILHEESFEQAMKKAVWALSGLTRALAVGMTERSTYYHGLSNVLSEPEYLGRPEAAELASLFDDMDTLIQEIPETNFNIFIGREMPLGKSAHCAMIISRPGSNSSIAVIGPMRMMYEKTIPLVKLASQLLEENYE